MADLFLMNLDRQHAVQVLPLKFERSQFKIKSEDFSVPSNVQPPQLSTLNSPPRIQFRRRFNALNALTL